MPLSAPKVVSSSWTGFLAAFALGLALAFGGFTTYQALSDLHEHQESHLDDGVRALAATLDARMETHIAALTVLSHAELLKDRANLARFHERAKATADALGGWIMLAASPSEGGVLLNTMIPFGGDLSACNTPEVKAAMAPVIGGIFGHRRPGTSNLYFDRSPNRRPWRSASPSSSMARSPMPCSLPSNPRPWPTC